MSNFTSVQVVLFVLFLHQIFRADHQSSAVVVMNIDMNDWFSRHARGTLAIHTGNNIRSVQHH